MNEAQLYSFLLNHNVLNLHGNRHFDFLNNLAKTCKTKAGLEAIEDYATSDSEIPPNTSHYNSDEEQLDEDAKIDDTEIETATSEELAILVENDNTLDSDVMSPIEQILSSTEILDSISTDKEAIQFYVTYAINQLWKDAFLDPEKTITTLENETKTDNKYRNLVVQTFLKDYRGTVNLILPKNYRFNDNSKISAGSVVQNDIPKNVLVMGNPSRIIKKIE